MKKILLTLITLSCLFSQVINFTNYQSLLTTYVDGNGLVNYKQLQANEKSSLNKIMLDIQKNNPLMHPNSYPERNDKLAAWLNIYNIIVLNEVVSYYPISSIQEIDNVWKKKHDFGDFKYSLDEIEKDIISLGFNEPRSHFAIICAAYSCPKLQQFIYIGSELEYQFQTITKDFFKNPLNFSLFKNEKKILISKLFEWYIQDFLYSPKNKESIKDIDLKEAIKKYVIVNAPASISDFIQANTEEITIEIMIWDWKLNESFH